MATQNKNLKTLNPKPHAYSSLRALSGRQFLRRRQLQKATLSLGSVGFISHFKMCGLGFDQVNMVR